MGLWEAVLGEGVEQEPHQGVHGQVLGDEWKWSQCGIRFGGERNEDVFVGLCRVPCKEVPDADEQVGIGQKRRRSGAGRKEGQAG